MPELDYYKHWAECQEPPVPMEAVEKWFNDPLRQYHCVFCGNHGNHSHFLGNILGKPIFGCQVCKNYKGVEPCIPGHCPFGEQ